MTRIVYLHGFASGPQSSKARYFRALLEQAGAPVAVPDLAEGDFENITITGQLAVIDRAVNGEPVSLIGSSLGGYLAALYAARHSNVAKAVLLAPAFGFARRWPERLGPANLAAWRHSGAIEVFHYAENRNRKLGYQLLADGERFEDNPDFTQQALIFHGSHDDSVPVRYSREFAAAHPNATLEVLDAGHDLLNVLDYMAPKILRFLSD
ncbi:MAG TPA: YqiA/YcfP family alpha/beta fold hydrolase [Bryobacteraceae bacterium]|nr:YqiA/YcfP family alpha/beta fold hydrolase [Bryobacteraceae bacterium]